MMKLSPTALQLFDKCPRCFYLEKVLNVPRPRGIFPSLPGGMDKVIKGMFDQFREGGGIPDGFPKGVSLYADQRMLNRWRNWRTGLIFEEDGVVLSGALDDLALEKGGAVSPVDYKTRGYPLKDDANPAEYYQIQLDSYALMAQRGANYAPSGRGFLVYFWPLSGELPEIPDLAVFWNFPFQVRVYEIEVNPDRARELLDKAHECLNLATAPDNLEGCEYCQYLSDAKTIA